MSIEIPLKAKYRRASQPKTTPYSARTGNRHGPKDPKILREKRWAYQPGTLKQQAAARSRKKAGPQ